MNLTTHKGEDNRPKNWNARRVAMEFANDRNLFYFTCYLVLQFGISEAVSILAELLEGRRTPDGAVFTKTAIRLALRAWR
jgi:hypothetical protein